MKKMNRFLAILMAAMMIVSFIAGNAVSVRAYDYITNGLVDPYYVTFMTNDADSPYNGMMAMHQSRHLAYFQLANGTYQRGIPNILPIVNKETGETIPAYCLDFVTGGEAYLDYRTLNLEDSGYYTTQNAAKIRKIFKNAFPMLDAAELEAAADEWLKDNGHSEIVDLTGAEALTATQYCIWMLANEDDLNVQNCYPYDYTLVKPNWDKSVWSNDAPVDSDEAPRSFEDGTSQTGHNITMLVEYLMSLEPESVVVTKDDIVVTSSELDDTVINVVEEDDGTWSVYGTVDIDATVEADDDLQLIVTAGDVVKTQAVYAPGELTFAILGLDKATAEGLIAIELTGYQFCEGVFMYDSIDARGKSQTMIAYAPENTKVAINARALVGEAERKLTIHKYGPVAGEDPSVKTPVENIRFSIYKVATMEEFENGFVLGEASSYIKMDNFVATVTTDANGVASYNFSRNDMPDGVYLVVELDSAVVKAPANPFFVSVPMTNDEGTGFVYDIHAYPKNDVEDDVEIDKDVTEIGNKTDTDDVLVNQTWIIRGSIPTGIYDPNTNTYAHKYTITDVLDHRLTYVENSLRAVVSNRAGEEIALEPDAHYLLTVTDTTDAEGNANKTIVVDLTAEGIAYVVETLGEGEQVPEIRVYFDTYINSNADLGVNIYNGATVDFENYAGWEYDSEVEHKPEVHTGGITLVKVDASNGQKLAGAKFTLNTRNEDGTYTPVAFYSNAAMTGEKVTEVVTDGSGNAVFYGLAYGTYYLIETEAPEGYNLLTEPVEVTIGANTHLTENAVTVKNSAEFRLPETGGIGTAVFTFGGSGLIGAAAMVLLGGKKKD